MRNFKYVKFSRGTAKQNPDMIIREYECLIYKLEDGLRLIDNVYIEIPLTKEMEMFVDEYRE